MEQGTQPQEKPAAIPPDDMRYEDYLKDYKDTCSEFKEMLREKELMPFSVFDKFLPKMIHDKRYTTVPHRFRRPLFDDLVKNYAVEFHKSKQAEKKVVQDALKSLLDEYEKTGGFLKKPSYKDFKKYFENGKRFAEVLKTFDVEKYFNVKLETFQKTLKDEQAKVKFQFTEMIREYFNEHPDKIDRDLKWKSVKKNFKKDPRYEKVDSSKDRESIFQNLIHELAKKHRERDRDRERSRSRDRKDRHDKKDRKDKTTDSSRVFKANEDQSTRLSKLKKMEAIDTYNILLAEKIKTYNIKYRDADDLLRKDPRYSDLDLDRETKEDLFDEYVEKKRQAAISVFKHMLEQKKFELHPELKFQDAIKIFEKDKRFDLNEKDAKKRFEEFMEHLKDEIHENFEKFLLETPLIHRDSHTEGEDFEHLLERLSGDIRYQRMEYRKEKRERMIKARIQVLKEEYEKKHGNHTRTDILGFS